MASQNYTVYAMWDSEANVWVATSEDIPGLATEADTVESLLKKLEIIIPELLEENKPEHPLHSQVPYQLLINQLIASAQV